MKKYNISLIVCCFVASHLKAQDRPIHWLHGFRGDNSAWFKAARATDERDIIGPSYPARKVKNFLTTYTPANSVVAIGSAGDAAYAFKLRLDELNLQPVDQSVANYPPFVIAHSQGGLVTRWAVDRTIPNTTSNMPNARHFGGIVTFGSPHLGARISNAVSGDNISFPEMDIFLNGACKKLGGAMADNVVQNAFGWMADGLKITSIVSGSVQNSKEKICDFLFSDGSQPLTPTTDNNGVVTFIPNSQKFVQRKIIGTFAGTDGAGNTIVDDPILRDYGLGAPGITTLNSMSLTPNVKRINFYGSELDNGAFFRTMHHATNDPAKAAPFQATDAIENTSVSNWQNVTRGQLANKAIANRIEANSVQCGSLWGFAFIPTWAAYCWLQENTANNLRKSAALMEEGVRWIDNADDQWLGMIGAKQQAVVQTSAYCICNVGAYPYSNNQPCSGTEWSRGCFQQSLFSTVTTRQDHDGVVVKSSATGMPGAVSVSDIDMRMEGSQHMQMKNDQRTMEKLLMVFDGRIDVYFRTEKRQ
jgi:hypothetical protein